MSIWHCFAMSSRREQEFKLNSHLRKVWKRSTKKLEEAGTKYFSIELCAYHKGYTKTNRFLSSFLQIVSTYVLPEPSIKKRLIFERSWLSELIKHFINVLYSIDESDDSKKFLHFDSF